MHLVQLLLNFSELASKIAQDIRNNKVLFELLVEEKTGEDKNARFTRDFKTLTDVLIQEILKRQISREFPNLTHFVKGEENTSFTNLLGESIDVRICSSESETASLLKKVLNDNEVAASSLAHLVHAPSECIQIDADVETKLSSLSFENVGIWIDPIDSTSEYVKGRYDESGVTRDVYHYGLSCCTVLVGIFDRSSGLATGGFVVQPFGSWDQSMEQWRSRIYWGMKTSPSTSVVNFSSVEKKKGKSIMTVAISPMETESIAASLRKKFEVLPTSGAGYKSLLVCLGHADAYVCSKGSTYRWDTCAPHGILSCVGGGVIPFSSFQELGRKQLLNADEAAKCQILYHEASSAADTSDTLSTKMWCNIGGIVAYRSIESLREIYAALYPA